LFEWPDRRRGILRCEERPASLFAGSSKSAMDAHRATESASFSMRSKPLFRTILAGKEAALARASDANKFILAQSGRTFLCAHHRAQDQARHLSQCGCTARRDHLLHRTSQRQPKAVPMDKISRRHSRLDRTLLRLQFANQGLKCHELACSALSPMMWPMPSPLFRAGSWRRCPPNPGSWILALSLGRLALAALP
jgi:hypothetical protein